MGVEGYTAKDLGLDEDIIRGALAAVVKEALRCKLMGTGTFVAGAMPTEGFNAEKMQDVIEAKKAAESLLCITFNPRDAKTIMRALQFANESPVHRAALMAFMDGFDAATGDR